MLRCPTCGCVLEELPEAAPTSTYANRVDPSDWFGGWLGLLSFVSFALFRLWPWYRRRRWCPRCRKTAEG